METDSMERRRSKGSTINSDKMTTRKIPANVPVWTSARYCLAYMAFFGFFNVYALRVNLSVAIVAMANSTNDSHQYSNECPTTTTNKTVKPGEFNWTASEKALILGAFFYGYICTQVLGGYLASRYGGKWLFGCGILCTTVFTLLTPLAARTNFALLIATRVIEGLGEGVTFPAMHAMWGMWVPPLERSRLVSLGYAGCHFGTFIAQPVSGVLCASNFLGGWPSVFYVFACRVLLMGFCGVVLLSLSACVAPRRARRCPTGYVLGHLIIIALFGTVALVWCLMWTLLVHNKPRDHPRISSAELEYIESRVSQEQTVLSDIPWLEIFKSVPVWGIVISHFTANWGFYTLLTCLPMYLKYVLRFDMTENGLISALPYFVMWASINISGFIADNLRERGVLNTTQTRKVFNSIGLIGPAIFLVAAGYTGCNNTLTVTFICLATMFNGFTFSGYAGILMGITNTFATIPGFVSPIVVQAITGNNETRAAWRIIFFIAAGMYVIGAILFDLMCSGEEQSWNKPRYERLLTNAPVSGGKLTRNENKNNSSTNVSQCSSSDSDQSTEKSVVA